MHRKSKISRLVLATIMAALLLLAYTMMNGDSAFQVVVNGEQVTGLEAWWYAFSGASLLMLLPLILLIVFLILFTSFGLMALMMVLGFGLLSIILLAPGPLWFILGLVLIYALFKKSND